jgi:hypothetical protein
MPSFCEAENVGTRPLPCTVSFCHSYAAGGLIRLSTRLSLHFGSTVDSRVVGDCLELVRLSELLSHRFCRLSYRLPRRLEPQSQREENPQASVPGADRPSGATGQLQPGGHACGV